MLANILILYTYPLLHLTYPFSSLLPPRHYGNTQICKVQQSRHNCFSLESPSKGRLLKSPITLVCICIPYTYCIHLRSKALLKKKWLQLLEIKQHISWDHSNRKIINTDQNRSFILYSILYPCLRFLSISIHR